jgi:transcriptional regulator with XRE-family HTH domain
MLPVELRSPREIARGVGERARALRLARGWTQVELARRAGMPVDTLRRFERTGKIALERLLMIAVVLDAARPFAELFAPPPARTLAELERLDAAGRAPRRARRRREKA